jgi:hypothetical protein
MSRPAGSIGLQQLLVHEFARCALPILDVLQRLPAAPRHKSNQAVHIGPGPTVVFCVLPRTVEPSAPIHGSLDQADPGVSSVLAGLRVYSDHWEKLDDQLLILIWSDERDFDSLGFVSSELRPAGSHQNVELRLVYEPLAPTPEQLEQLERGTAHIEAPGREPRH